MSRFDSQDFEITHQCFWKGNAGSQRETEMAKAFSLMPEVALYMVPHSIPRRFNIFLIMWLCLKIRYTPSHGQFNRNTDGYSIHLFFSSHDFQPS